MAGTLNNCCPNNSIARMLGQRFFCLPAIVLQMNSLALRIDMYKSRRMVNFAAE